MIGEDDGLSIFCQTLGRYPVGVERLCDGYVVWCDLGLTRWSRDWVFFPSSRLFNARDAIQGPCAALEA